MIDSLLTDLADSGWLVNNAYQTDDGLWRVNIRRPTPTGDWFTDWSVGPTLADAISDCMSKLLDAEFATTKQPIATIEPSVDLVTALGLKPTPAPILRRF